MYFFQKIIFKEHKMEHAVMAKSPWGISLDICLLADLILSVENSDLTLASATILHWLLTICQAEQWECCGKQSP